MNNTKNHKQNTKKAISKQKLYVLLSNAIKDNPNLVGEKYENTKPCEEENKTK